MKNNNIPFASHLQKSILCLAILLLCAVQSMAQVPYQFVATEYVSTDDARAPQSAFSYDTEANTLTINGNSGYNNIAFKNDVSAMDGKYYIEQDQTWFAVAGTNLSTTLSQSYIWWFNGYNKGAQIAAKYAATKDGQTVVVWDIANNELLNANMDYTQRRISISAHGTDFINALGLSAKSGRSATLTDIGYYSKYELAATYPALLSKLGYTATSLTTTLTNKVKDEIAAGRSAISSAPEEEAQTFNATLDAFESRLTALEATAYTEAQSLLHEVKEAVNNFKVSSTIGTYTLTDAGARVKYGNVNIDIIFYTDDIIRVVKSPLDEVNKTSWSVVLHPTSVSVSNQYADNLLTLSTSKASVLIDLKKGTVEVERPDGTSVISEKAATCSFMECKDGQFDSYQIGQTFQLTDDERIYGMGQIQDGKLDRRGTSVTLEQNNMKICIPYFQSTAGYGLFWDNYSPTVFTDNPSGARFSSTGTEIDYYVLVGSDSRDVLREMRLLTGQAQLMPLWNFGLYQSKERYQSANEVMQVLDEYRNRQVPLDCMVQDWQYWGDNAHWNALSFLNPTYSNYQEMIDHVHDKGAHLMISIWANFGPQSEPYKELDKLGRLIPVETYPSGEGVHPYDVYDSQARDIYWKYLYNGLASKGVDAYWMDSTEPDYYKGSASELDYLSGCGQTWRSLRNVFVLGHVKGAYEHHREAEAKEGDPLNGKRVSILTRSGFAGQQRYAAQSWSGDVTASWENFARQIPAALNFSMCGTPYWNSDTGGFFVGGYGGVGDGNWRQLYTRWAQFSTFCPMMRFHGCGTPREIYQFGSEGDATGDYDQILKYVKIRYHLLPYNYSTAWQVRQNAQTFMQPLGFAFDNDPEGFDITDQYMYGQSFLVCPVVTEGACQRSLYLPNGTGWTDFWTGERYEGGQIITKRGGVDIMPLYVRAGSIVPWGPEVQYSEEKQWNDLELRVYPGANGQFTLYEDENDNYNFEKGQYSEIPMQWDNDSHTLTIGTRRGEFAGMLKERTFRVVLVNRSAGFGDQPSTTYQAEIKYNGEAVSVVLEETEAPIATEPTDVTEQYITNPSFETGNFTGWTVSSSSNLAWSGVNTGGGSGDPQATDGTKIAGVWDGNVKWAEIAQTITLPQGRYRLTVDMHASNRTNQVRVGKQRVFAGEAEGLFADQVLAAGSGDNYPLQTISVEFDIEEDNTQIKIGAATSDAPTETWFKVDNFRLYELGEYVPTGIGKTQAQQRTNVLYDLSGRRIADKPGRGFYIKNNKKYVR